MNSRSVAIFAVVVAVIVGVALWFIGGENAAHYTAPPAEVKKAPVEDTAGSSEPSAPPRKFNPEPVFVPDQAPVVSPKPPVVMTEDDRKIDDALNLYKGNTDQDHLNTAQALITLLPSLTKDGQVEAASHISNLLPDEAWSKLNHIWRNPSFNPDVLEVFETDLMNREDKVKLPALLEAIRMAAQELKVRRESLLEQFKATQFELEAVTAAIAPDATIASLEQAVAEVSGKIERLGQVNLAAIDEFKEQSERKEYLDRQFADLTDALETLETAIRKIERETRSRFQDTFDRVNAGLKDRFPRLFGGGHAYLELTGEDVLNAGVSIMARPPGKRNSTINQLSGGEKALTAVALVFSIFELNPAPFCLLDEVDAPLDDNNVGRFCETVKEMSSRVQFIFITHNKTTMEMASQLLGVTMHEPGVSRLVSVDVDEAVRMAAM